MSDPVFFEKPGVDIVGIVRVDLKLANAADVDAATAPALAVVVGPEHLPVEEGVSHFAPGAQNGQPTGGAFPEQRGDGTSSSTAGLALSETWIRPE